MIAAIVRAAAARPGERLVEIGPGRGALTVPLLAAAGRLTAIEIDRDLAADLRRRRLPGLTLIEADVLQVDFAALRGDGPRLRLLGNLPYNISTPLLFALFRVADELQDMLFMVQKEVAQRLAATPGTAAYGRLSVMVGYYCRVDTLFEVGPGAFRPPPRVRSTVVRLSPHRRPPVVVDDPERLAGLVAMAFSQRRKTLRNSLKNALDDSQINAAGVDPGARPETLGLVDFARLCERLEHADAAMGQRAGDRRR